MVAIKAYPDITSKLQLLNKERKWMKKLNATLNQIVPGNLLKLGKTEYDKQCAKQYRIKNKLLEKIKCECGCMTSRNHIERHRKSKKHQDKMNDLPTIEQ